MTRTRSAVSWAAILGCGSALALACTDASPHLAEPSFGKGGNGGSSGDPTVSEAIPPSAPQDTTLDVRVLGTNFDRGSRVQFERVAVIAEKLTVNSTRFRSSSELIANVTIATDADPGGYDVIVVTSGGKKGIGADAFAVEFPAEELEGGLQVNAISENGLFYGGEVYIRIGCDYNRTPALWDDAGIRTDLPTMGYCAGVVTGVNSTGVAVGLVANKPPGGPGVRWTPMKGGYQAEFLPLVGGGRDYSRPVDINETGQVLFDQPPAVLALAATQWQPLEVPEGCTNPKATALNDLGAAVGYCYKVAALYWASPTEAPVFLPLPSGAESPFVKGLNNAGVAVGYVRLPAPKRKYNHSTVAHPVRWTLSDGAWSVEVLPDLGEGGFAFDVNQEGVISGRVNVAEGRGAVWHPGAELQLLGILRGSGGNSGAWPYAISGTTDQTGLTAGGQYDNVAVRWRLAP